jgi:hypothetical protein
MNHPKQAVLILLATAVLAVTQLACGPTTTNSSGDAPSKSPAKLTLKGYYTHRPWTKGGFKQALNMSQAGTTIPMSQYSFTASKDGRQYTGVLAGTSPFATPPAGSTISAVIVPLKITIGSAVFDAGAANPCDANVPALTRLRQSPLVNDVPNLTMNGVNVGNAQFINGLRRAEFWKTIQGSPMYQNELGVSYANSFELTATMVGSHGTTAGSGCSQLGILASDWLDGILQGNVIPALTASGAVSPKAVVFFLLKNTVQSEVDPPTEQACCILGYHSAMGSPVQTYGTMNWDTSGNFGSGTSDASISSHEIGEWMDDPLGNNATPPWGNIGQVSGCQNNWEVGDPLSGTLMPAITMNGKAYQMQELAFFSWFFNKSGDPSVGAGATFSSNGTFHGPSRLCPPGGTN